MIFDEIQKGIQFVVNRSRNVHLNKEKLAEIKKKVIKTVSESDFFYQPELLDFPKNLTLEERLMFVFIWSLGDFCYWPSGGWSKTFQGQNYQESKALQACYHEALMQGIDILNPAVIEGFSLDEYEQIVGNDTPCGLCFNEWRLRFIQAGVRRLRQKYNGSVLSFLSSCHFDAEKMVEVLSTFVGMDDRHMYWDEPVLFLEKVQRMVCRLDEIYAIETGVHFVNIDKVITGANDKTACALRQLGVVSFSDDLKKHVTSETGVADGSESEVEIRAVSAHAMRHLRQAVQDKVPFSSAGHLDEILWMMAQSQGDDNIKRHKTLTWFY